MSSLSNDLITWAGKARAQGRDRIEIDLSTAEYIARIIDEHVQILEVIETLPKKVSLAGWHHVGWIAAANELARSVRKILVDSIDNS